MVPFPIKMPHHEVIISFSQGNLQNVSSIIRLEAMPTSYSSHDPVTGQMSLLSRVIRLGPQRDNMT